MHRLFAVAAAMTWAISPQWLSTILTIANREGAGPEAVAKELGRPLDNTRKVEMRGDVAMIPVCGPIFRRANMLSEVSGATSIQVLAQDFNAALANDDVKSIVLEIDSPGGEVTGVSEFAEMVFAARGSKPIVAYVGGDGCSAAYWIASACEHIVVADTAIVGSIGVVRAIPNPGAGTASAIEIVSSQSPNKRPDVKTSKGRAVFQAEVDALADVFVATVARNRGVSTKTVLKSFGQGGCLIGRNAVDAGMADGVGALESVIASFVPRAQAQETAVAAANPNPAPASPAPCTTRKEHPMSKRPSPPSLPWLPSPRSPAMAGGSISRRRRPARGRQGQRQGRGRRAGEHLEASRPSPSATRSWLASAPPR
jgi:ClpP class serine protease